LCSSSFILLLALKSFIEINGNVKKHLASGRDNSQAKGIRLTMNLDQEFGVIHHAGKNEKTP
jgi:hypothetical protein